jgi:hypothetical protein
MKSKGDGIRAARIALYRAEDKLEREVEKEHPVGSHITWLKRDHLQSGTVVACGQRGLKVNNTATDKTYWIDVFDIYGAIPLEAR